MPPFLDKFNGIHIKFAEFLFKVYIDFYKFRVYVYIQWHIIFWGKSCILRYTGIPRGACPNIIQFHRKQGVLSMSRLSVGQMHSITGDIERNIDKISFLVGEAARQDAKMIMLPELAVTGYRADEKFDILAQTLDGSIVGELARISGAHGGIWIYTTIPEKNGLGGKPYNTGVLVNSEGLQASYRKIHLWSREPDFFSPGTLSARAQTPVGKAGLMICFDISYPEIARVNALCGCDLLLYSMAFSPRPREYALDLFSRTRALENVCFSAVSNHTGLEKDTEFFGSSRIISPDGQILAQLKQEEGVVSAEIDHSILQELRARYPYLSCRKPTAYST